MSGSQLENSLNLALNVIRTTRNKASAGSPSAQV